MPRRRLNIKLTRRLNRPNRLKLNIRPRRLRFNSRVNSVLSAKRGQSALKNLLSHLLVGGIRVTMLTFVGLMGLDLIMGISINSNNISNNLVPQV